MSNKKQQAAQLKKKIYSVYNLKNAQNDQHKAEIKAKRRKAQDLAKGGDVAGLKDLLNSSSSAIGKQETKKGDLWRGLILLLFGITIFTIPLIYSRSTQQIFEFNKFVFLLLAASIICLVYGGGLIFGKFRLRQLKRQEMIIIGAFLLFLISMINATLSGVSPATSFWGSYIRSHGLLTYLASFFLAFIAASLRPNKREIIVWFLVPLIAAALVQSLIMMMQYIFPDRYFTDLVLEKFAGRSVGTFGQPNFAGRFVMFGLLSLVGTGIYWLGQRTKLSLSLKIICWFLLAIVAALMFSSVGVYSASRQALVGIAAGIFTFSLFYGIIYHSWRQFYFILSFSVTFLVVLVVMLLVGEQVVISFEQVLDSLAIVISLVLFGYLLAIVLLDAGKNRDYWRFLMSGPTIATLGLLLAFTSLAVLPLAGIKQKIEHRSEAIEMRVLAYREAPKAVYYEPIFGWGVDNQEEALAQVASDQLYVSSGGAILDRVHNEILDMLLQVGFFGLFLYLAFLIVALGYNWRKITSNFVDLTLAVVIVSSFIARQFGFFSVAEIFYFFLFLALLVFGLDQQGKSLNYSKVNKAYIAYPLIIFSVFAFYARTVLVKADSGYYAYDHEQKKFVSVTNFSCDQDKGTIECQGNVVDSYELVPWNKFYNKNLIKALIQNNKQEQLNTKIEEVIANFKHFHPHHAEVYNLEALYWRNYGNDRQKELAAIQKALELFPANHFYKQDLYLLKAKLAYLDNDFAQALDNLSLVLRINPKNNQFQARNLFQWARFLESQGQDYLELRQLAEGVLSNQQPEAVSNAEDIPEELLLPE
jgi:hypothetical protein